jgi:hypothetical protein
VYDRVSDLIERPEPEATGAAIPAAVLRALAHRSSPQPKRGAPARAVTNVACYGETTIASRRSGAARTTEGRRCFTSATWMKNRLTATMRMLAPIPCPALYSTQPFVRCTANVLKMKKLLSLWLSIIAAAASTAFQGPSSPGQPSPGQPSPDDEQTILRVVSTVPRALYGFIFRFLRLIGHQATTKSGSLGVQHTLPLTGYQVAPNTGSLGVQRTELACTQGRHSQCDTSSCTCECHKRT